MKYFGCYNIYLLHIQQSGFNSYFFAGMYNKFVKFWYLNPATSCGPLFQRRTHPYVDREWHTQFYKNSGHLKFPCKHVAILDFVCFWTF